MSKSRRAIAAAVPGHIDNSREYPTFTTASGTVELQFHPDHWTVLIHDRYHRGWWADTRLGFGLQHMIVELEESGHRRAAHELDAIVTALIRAGMGDAR